MASATVRLIAINGVIIGTGKNAIPQHEAALEALAKVIQPRTCVTCMSSKFSEDGATMYCEKVKANAPAWAIAYGCDNHDYLPF